MQSENAFDKIYAEGGWDGLGSGPGSTEDFTRSFRAWFGEQLTALNPTKIIDLGCGDWQWQKHMNWQTRSYIGVDIAKSVITLNAASFSTKPPYPRFYPYNAVTFALGLHTAMRPTEPRLILIKDVLHHLSQEDADRLVLYLADETVLWVADVTDAGKVIVPSDGIRAEFFDDLPVAFEFERPQTYRYGRKVAMLQKQ